MEPPASIPKQGPVIAIDGPAGTGKSTTTKRLCEALGFVHIDTGAIYRSVAFISFEKDYLSPEDFATKGMGVELSSELQEKITLLARTIHFEFKRDPRRNPANRVYANGVDITDRIRTPEVSLAASKVSGIPGVRAALLGLQRRLGCQGRAILEGRDIGTIVFPDADVKFFLTANIEERAKRRLIELEVSGADTPSFEDLKNQISERDQADQTRVTAPLKKALDAIELDTTRLSLDQVVDSMKLTIRERIGI